ncbi:hypothetical protein [Thalassospira sp. MIT1370]|uniref:hypothetical protein n=1 Tax=unclassified Thalassospira TaxID=2648997 RepID=UPI00399A68A8
MKSLFAPLAFAFAFAFALSGTAQAADVVKPTSACHTKISSTFRMIELYVKTDQVNEFTLDQIDITRRQCEDATDPKFKSCHDGFEKVAELAHAGQGLEAYMAMGKTASPECADYFALHWTK